VNPTVKYTLARFGLFAAAAAVFLAIPVPVDVLVKLMAAVLVSALLSYTLLRRLREAMSVQLAGTMRRRAEQRDRLRTALAGDDDEDESRT
jgi:Protein of unknown function (DUF4229)